MLEIAVVFLIGLFTGSFLNVLADRLPREESAIKGRSHCENCKKTLKWFDLIPLLSFLLLRGKCRHCHSTLSFYYPITELTTGILFVITLLFTINNFQSIYNLQFSIPLIYYLFIISSLIVVFFADLKYGIIPDKIVFPTILVSFFFFFVQPAIFEAGLINHLLSAVGACLFFLALFIGTKGRGMGFGDVKFAFLIGLILGFPKIIVALYVAFLTGALCGIILVLWRRKKIAGTAIPFGPFLVLGTLSALFWGEIILQKIFQVLR